MRKHCNDLYETIKKWKMSKCYLCHKAAIFQTRERKKEKRKRRNKLKKGPGKLCESCPYTRVLVKDTLLRTLSQSRSPGTTNPCPEGPQLLTAFHLLLSYNPRVLISIQNLPSFSDLCFQLRLSPISPSSPLLPSTSHHPYHSSTSDLLISCHAGQDHLLFSSSTEPQLQLLFLKGIKKYLSR